MPWAQSEKNRRGTERGVEAARNVLREVQTFVRRWELPERDSLFDLWRSYRRWDLGRRENPNCVPVLVAGWFPESPSGKPVIRPESSSSFRYYPDRAGLRKRVRQAQQEVEASIVRQADAFDAQARREGWTPIAPKSVGKELEKGARRLYRHLTCRMTYEEITQRESLVQREEFSDTDAVREMLRKWRSTLGIEGSSKKRKSKGEPEGG